MTGRIVRIVDELHFIDSHSEIIMLAVILIAVLCLAFANGANDNFKGVATLFGSGTTNYRLALAWATLATLLGSMTAMLLAGSLLKSFSGKGLVSTDTAASIEYAAAVSLGAGLTVLLATRLGMPISTTHSLMGALLGAGWAAGSVVHFETLQSDFLAPLLVSPLLAIAMTGLLYPVLTRVRLRLGVTSETCLCVGNETVQVIPRSNDALVARRVDQLSVQVGSTVTCRNRYRGRLMGVEVAAVMDRLHFLSAGIVCFARGMNDTPKIAALLLLAPALGELASTALVGGVIAIGGVVYARRVADTMSQRITAMNHGQGFTANLVTGAIVMGASRMGLPVSTTHVSCGSLFGLGTVSGQAQWGVIARILAAWVFTLPIGGAMGACSYWIIRLL